jgi:hypothetical protein
MVRDFRKAAEILEEGIESADRVWVRAIAGSGIGKDAQEFVGDIHLWETAKDRDDLPTWARPARGKRERRRVRNIMGYHRAIQVAENTMDETNMVD